MEGGGPYSVPILNRRLECPSLDRSSSFAAASASPKGAAEKQEPLQTRRLSIMEGRYKVVVSLHVSMVEVLVESKQSGDVYGKEITTSTLGTAGSEGLFDEPRHIYEFMLQTFQEAGPPPSGLGHLQQTWGDGAEESVGGNLVSYLWEGGKSAYLRVTMQPQYAFMKPLVVSMELPRVAHATTQQKFAIHLQSHAQMSQQLLTEQMVSFGKEVDQQRAQFENHVAEKLNKQHALMLDEVAKFEKKLQATEHGVITRVTKQQQQTEARVSSLTAELTQLKEQLAESLTESMLGIREEFQRQLQITVDAVGRPVDALERGIYYVIVKGCVEELGASPRSSFLMGGTGMLMGSPVSRMTSPGRVGSARRSGAASKTSSTAFRVWTSGSLTKDELWHVFNSELTGRRRSTSMIPASKLIGVERETDSHVEGFRSKGKHGKYRISGGSITPNGQLLCEFIFP